MPSYAFRARFHLPSESHIVNDLTDINFTVQGRTFFLESFAGGGIEGSFQLVLTSGGFPSAEEARAWGQQAKKALLFCGPGLGLGINPGQEEEITKPLETGGDTSEEQFVQQIDGLQVYRDDVKTSFVSASLTATIDWPAAGFIKEFVETFQLNPVLSKKQSLALELYSASHFESSARAKFLTLMQSVESLCVRKDRSSEAMAHIADFFARTQAGPLDEEDKKLLINSLKNLKKESFRKTAADLIRDYLGKESAKQFRLFYKVRGNLLHEGDAGEDSPNVGPYTVELDKLVSRLLSLHIRKSAST